MSITQKTNWVAFAGLIVTILGLFGVQIVQTDVELVIGALVTLIGVVSNYIHRYRKGDLNIVGARR